MTVNQTPDTYESDRALIAVSNMNIIKIEKASRVLKSINHTLRRKILRTIQDFDKPTVTEIYMKLGLSQSLTSQHLGILRNAGLVLVRREGKFSYYSINASRIQEISKLVENYI